MTPYEFSLVADTYVEKEKAAQEERLVLAYMTAAWARAKKMPSLKKLLKQEKKTMTDEEMLRVVEAFNAAFGGEDRRCKNGSS